MQCGVMRWLCSLARSLARSVGRSGRGVDMCSCGAVQQSAGVGRSGRASASAAGRPTHPPCVVIRPPHVIAHASTVGQHTLPPPLHDASHWLTLDAAGSRGHTGRAPTAPVRLKKRLTNGFKETAQTSQLAITHTYKHNKTHPGCLVRIIVRLLQELKMSQGLGHFRWWGVPDRTRQMNNGTTKWSNKTRLRHKTTQQNGQRAKRTGKTQQLTKWKQYGCGKEISARIAEILSSDKMLTKCE